MNHPDDDEPQSAAAAELSACGDSAAANACPPPRTAELRALQVARDVAANRILCTTLGRGQAAAQLAEERPTAQTVCWFLDQYQQRLAIAAQPPRDNLAFTCAADAPAGTFDLAVVPLSFRGEAELARDVIQDAFAHLAIGGRLVAAVDNPRDQWLHGQLREMFPKVSVITTEDAAVYVVLKRDEQRRPRSLRCQFAYRDGSRLLQAVTRPGVFAHRRLDPGARQLIDAVPPWPEPSSPRIIDIGCGSGMVGIALAARQAEPQNVHCLSLDSNARAIQCTVEAARLNAIDGLVARLDSTGTCDTAGSYDIAVANPPYYADFRIARLFVDTAATALRPGGMLYLVTKHPAWYQENLFPFWRDTELRPSGSYFIVSSRRG